MPELRAEREQDSFGVIREKTKKMRGWRTGCVSQVAASGKNAPGSIEYEGGREGRG